MCTVILAGLICNTCITNSLLRVLPLHFYGVIHHRVILMRVASHPQSFYTFMYYCDCISRKSELGNLHKSFLSGMFLVESLGLHKQSAAHHTYESTLVETAKVGFSKYLRESDSTGLEKPVLNYKIKGFCCILLFQFWFFSHLWSLIPFPLYLAALKSSFRFHFLIERR